MPSQPQQMGRRPVPTLIHDGKAWVEAQHYDEARALQGTVLGILANIRDEAQEMSDPVNTDLGESAAYVLEQAVYGIAAMTGEQR